MTLSHVHSRPHMPDRVVVLDGGDLVLDVRPGPAPARTRNLLLKALGVDA